MDIQELIDQLYCCQSQEEYDALFAAYGTSEDELCSILATASANGASFLANEKNESHTCLNCGSSELQWDGSTVPRDGCGVMYQVRYLCLACRNRQAHTYNAWTGEMYWE